ncbi:type IV pilin, partial [Candidatus Bathyarchaeota archaeon]|nr:type IV pilin [Candidatus Bathyarchaeota archaeon]
MKDFRRNRLALSTVVTTLIILVVSVLLAGVVSYFAINVTSTRVQEESVHITKQHIWSDGTSAQAAFLIVNTGGRDLVIDKISARGQESAWSEVFYN